jgi:TrmH family RNA methyltransferase
VDAGRFLIEGPPSVSEALAEHERSGFVVDELFLSAEAAQRYADLGAQAYRLGIPVHEVADAVAAALSTTRTPQGVVAVGRIPQPRLADIVAGRPRLVAVLCDVADPGNAGTAIRTADAAGADAVVLAGDAVDAFNPKCVRASAGSLFHLPVVTGVSVEVASDALRGAGMVVRAADSAGPVDLDQLEHRGELDRSTAWLFGNETHGLTPAVLAAADAVVRIPIHGRAESLNLAAAVAVCLYASARGQRR